MSDKALEETIAALRDKLLAARGSHGHWEGRLSSSALSTATAVFALAVADRARYRSLVDRGLLWLCENQNADGGWGDTVDSPSNLSTTMLCYSALAIPDGPSACSPCVEKTELWLLNKVGSLDPRSLAAAVEVQYGKDRTFSVPILTMCALNVRQGPYVFGAHSDDVRLGRPIGRRPQCVEAGSALALRAGGSATAIVQMATSAGGELCATCADRDRAGPVCLSQAC